MMSVFYVDDGLVTVCTSAAADGLVASFFEIRALGF
jgi:hypothetical protein